jgi:hypothetical protein
MAVVVVDLDSDRAAFISAPVTIITAVHTPAPAAGFAGAAVADLKADAAIAVAYVVATAVHRTWHLNKQF